MFDIGADGKFHITSNSALAFKRMAKVIGVSEKELEDYLRVLWYQKILQRTKVVLPN